MDRRNFLSLSAAGLVAAGLPFSPAARALPLPPGTPQFKRWRRKLVDLLPAQQMRLCRAIATHVEQPGVVTDHYIDNGSHGIGIHRFESEGLSRRGFAAPLGYGATFFSWHRTYIGKLERNLQGRSLASWAPWEIIPPAFLRNGAHQTRMTRADFATYSDDVIGHIEDEDTLGVQLSWGPHFETHIRTGGDMMVVELASRSPIFWPWHAFVDDLHRTWQDRRKRYGNRQPDPKFCPWTNCPIPPRGTLGIGNGIRTPFCLTKTLAQAREAIGRAGLSFGGSDTSANSARVVGQEPLPWVELPPGGAVKLRTKLPGPDEVVEAGRSLYPPRVNF